MVEEAVLISEEKTVQLKKAIAKVLYSKGFDQLKISKILNLSQPMVSNYCSSKDNIPYQILEYANLVSEKIINGNKISLQLCISFSEENLIGRFFIAQENEVISEEKNKIIDNLTEAFFNLKGKSLTGLIPKVKINIAMSKENSHTTNDIAAFLNGLIIVDDKITANNGISFGKSKHLSSLLLTLKKEIKINSIMNVAYLKNIEKTNFSYDFLTKDFKIKYNGKKVDILLHKGDFGIEPCAYILGENATEVVSKVLKIKEEIL